MKCACRGNWLGIWALAGLALTLLALPASAQFDPGGPPPATPDVPEGAEVLTRGPVHEAFAEPVAFDPRPGVVVPRQPPQPVEEMAPDQMPEGTNVQWIPGYWAWDDSRNDFLWLSGLWRDIPPGRQWVPGYWTEADGGYRWVSGVWNSTVQEDVQYYSAPPQTLEAGPSSPQPSANSVWSPGHWNWRGNRFLWRPGFWVGFQPNWVWVPAHYVWTPSGYLFVDGYWDYPFAVRGTPFAPVYFAQPVYLQPRFVYTPTISLLASAMVTSFFIRPSYNQYYFGDYYAQSYSQAGFLPWYSYNQSRRGYDPLFAHYSVVQSRRDPRWLARMQDDYRFRRDHVDARPPHTYREQQTIINRTTVDNINVNNSRTSVNNARNLVLARPIAQIAENPDQTRKFTRVDAARRQEMSRQAEQLRDFRTQRQKQEFQAASLQDRANVRDQSKALAKAANPLGPGAQPRRAERFRSPITASPAQTQAETNLGRRSPDLVDNAARRQSLEQLKTQRAGKVEQLKTQRQLTEQLKDQEQAEQKEQLKAQKQQQRLEQLKAQQDRQQLQPQRSQRQTERLEQLKTQKQDQQLEQVKAQQDRQQLQLQKGQRQREQLEQLKTQKQDQQLEQVKAQQDRQQLQLQKGQRQREQLEQLKTQKQDQQLEQVKAQQDRQQLQLQKGQRRTEQLERLKGQRQQQQQFEGQQQLEQLRAQRQQQQLEQLKAQQGQQQIEQMKARRERLQQEQGKAQQQRAQPQQSSRAQQQLERLKAQPHLMEQTPAQQKQQFDQLKAQRKQRLEQLKAQERP